MARNFFNIDFEFTHKSEGGSKLKGYVPYCDYKSVNNKNNVICFGKEVGTVIGKSGVTIAAGFDLGQNNLHDLQKLNLPADLQLKLTPYLLKKKKPAFDFLKNNPLVISESESKLINRKKKELHAKQLQKKFNTYSKANFEDLPKEIQTVLFSITYQYGLNATKTTLHSLWLAALSLEFDKMETILLRFETYKERRKKEAGLIKKMIENSKHKQLN